MKWIRESMTQIDLVDGEKKLAYIAYKNFRWLLYEGGEEWGIDLKIYEQHQVEVAQMAAVEELIRYHAEKAKLSLTGIILIAKSKTDRVARKGTTSLWQDSKRPGPVVSIHTHVKSRRARQEQQQQIRRLYKKTYTRRER